MEDSFCIFLVFYKSSKISGLKEWAELVASQLTQVYLLMQIKNKIWENQWLENSVYFDFITP